MHAATSRSAVAAAALATAGLLALPHPTTSPQVEPTVQRGVALVDVTSDLLTFESMFDTEAFNYVLGSTGEEEMLYTDFNNAGLAGLLDTGTVSPAYIGEFDGAESQAFEGLFLDSLAVQDQLNQALGVSTTASETAILADIANNPGPPLPIGDSLPAVGATDFDTDLQTIANGDFALALSDFEAYLQSLPTDLGSLGMGSIDLGSDLGNILGLLGDLGSFL